MLSYRVHLIRTGATSPTPGKIYVGQADLPLCDQGRESLAHLRETYAYPEVDTVYSSPLVRCLETADILYPDQPPQIVDGLMDMHLGVFQGHSLEELQGDAAFSRWLTNSVENPPPEGELVDAFTLRVVEAFGGLLRDMMTSKTQSAAVITHGGVIMTLLAAMAMPRLPLHQWAAGNGCGYTLLTNTQLWMRDRCGEVVSFLPLQVEDGEEDLDDALYDLEEDGL